MDFLRHKGEHGSLHLPVVACTTATRVCCCWEGARALWTTCEPVRMSVCAHLLQSSSSGSPRCWGGSWGDRRSPSGGSQALHWVLYIFTPQQGVGKVSCQLVHQDQGPTLPHTGQMHTGACHTLPLTAQQALRSATLSCRSSCCARRWPGLRSPQWT